MSSDGTENEKLGERWPTDGDRLFVDAVWTHGAPVARDSKERLYRMPMAYKRTGDLLVHQAAAEVVDRKNVIYPALFCYRQSIELFLKRLIEEFGSESVEGALTHNLAQLWERFARISSDRGSDDSLGFDAACKLIMEMHEADQRSDGFRFPSDHHGESFRFGNRTIDLENLYEVMQGLENFFECTYTEFSFQDDYLVHGNDMSMEHAVVESTMPNKALQRPAKTLPLSAEASATSVARPGFRWTGGLVGGTEKL